MFSPIRTAHSGECDVAVTVDEARRVNVHILSVVEVDWRFDQWGDEGIGIIAAFAGTDDATLCC